MSLRHKSLVISGLYTGSATSELFFWNGQFVSVLGQLLWNTGVLQLFVPHIDVFHVVVFYQIPINKVLILGGHDVETSLED